ncbi:Bifunctional uridylyltransferase/uridylyl-removing enzyme [Frankliniella fusca]|uniref:Bifunctional uridylyltransferase/uridylyl-removing enzyme n=1 Tax=Frankliniella fusca TaxID=407009 RepID=A0AAE1GV12_9NEOP|nr:Bifunctional uridylyltransferase/uridylyl-removing enzyme [Frankliniella fusca]
MSRGPLTVPWARLGEHFLKEMGHLITVDSAYNSAAISHYVIVAAVADICYEAGTKLAWNSYEASQLKV